MATIGKSVAVKFDLYNNAGEGPDSTGLYLNGPDPTVPAVDMTSSGVDLHSGHVFSVHIVYDGTNLTMTITDTTNTALTFTQALAGQHTRNRGREYRICRFHGRHWRVYR